MWMHSQRWAYYQAPLLCYLFRNSGGLGGAVILLMTKSGFHRVLKSPSHHTGGFASPGMLDGFEISERKAQLLVTINHSLFQTTHRQSLCVGGWAGL